MSQPRLQITVTQGPDQGKKLLLEPGKTYRIGCGSEDDLVLTDPMVLKGHCSLEITADGVVLRNHTASAGTFIGEKKIAQARIPAKATFRIGDSAISLRPVAVQKPAAKSTQKPATTSGAASNGPRRGGPNDPLVGKIVGGYKLLEVVGRGGMGTVYRAVQLSLQREVALKVLARKYSRDKNFRDLFINEAQAAAQLVHPNIVQVYDAGIEGDVSYFSMEFISQGSVEEILKRDKQIPWQEAILLVLEAAHGLEYAEGKRIVHRDIKPDNLMLNEDGRIKIADLGLAKQGEGGADQGIIGTPHFIPPEQALGKNVDTRADIYSLGATFFRMITGRTLFTGKTAKEIVLKHIKEPAPAASSVVKDVPDELDAVMAKMLAKNPDARFASASDLVVALETICAHHGIKGAVIKRGVSKKVLVPLVVLLVGAAVALYFAATRDRETVDITDYGAIEAAKKEQERLKAKNAAADRELRRGKIERELGDLKFDFVNAGGKNGVLGHRDELDGQEDARARMWLGYAVRFEAFAKRPDVIELSDDDNWNKTAEEFAADIRKTVEEVKQTSQDKQRQIGEWVKQAEDLFAKKRGELSARLQAQKFSDAYVMAEELSRDKPHKNDPFEKLLDQEWVSKLNSKTRQTARMTKRVTDQVEKAREYFALQKKDIPESAEKAYREIAKNIPELDAIPAASDEDLEKARAALDPVIKNFGNKQPNIRDLSTEAGSRRRSIDRELKKRVNDRLLADRAAVRQTLRQQRSLDSGAEPNNVMNGDFAVAKGAWQRLLIDKTVLSPRYVAFVQERINALGYLEYLFAQFRADVRATAASKSTGPLGDLKSVLPTEGRPFKFSLKSAPAGDDDAGSFYLSKRYKGRSELRYSAFGMDWVLDSIFRVPGGAPNQWRWRKPTPIVQFSLAVFCFETMQYEEAVEAFSALTKDATYGAVADRYAKQARIEAAARAEYEGLLKAAREAKSAAEVQKVMDDLEAYSQKHAGTLFYVDVMPKARKMDVDVAPAIAKNGENKIPRLPVAPNAPR